MASVNKVILVGNCGRDPEVRYTPSGMAICNLSIATTSRRRDKQSGDAIEDTQWHRVTFYDRLAEVAGEYLKKGRPVYVEGRLKYGKYTDKDGIERYTADIVATEMQLLGGRESGSSESHESGPTTHAAPATRESTSRHSAPSVPNAPSRQGGPNAYAEAKAGRAKPQPQQEEFRDSIPF